MSKCSTRPPAGSIDAFELYETRRYLVKLGPRGIDTMLRAGVDYDEVDKTYHLIVLDPMCEVWELGHPAKGFKVDSSEGDIIKSVVENTAM